MKNEFLTQNNISHSTVQYHSYYSSGSRKVLFIGDLKKNRYESLQRYNLPKLVFIFVCLLVENQLFYVTTIDLLGLEM